MFQTLIASVTVGSGGATSIDFTSIPGTYTDLTLVYSLRTTAAATGDSPRVQVNADGGTNYISTRYLQGDGTTISVSGGAASSTFFFDIQGATGANATTSTFSNGQIVFLNYASTSARTLVMDNVTENNAAQAYQVVGGATYSGASAITSISLYNVTFAQYSTAYLYGTLKGSGGATAA